MRFISLNCLLNRNNFSKIRIEKLKTIYISSAAKLILSNLSPNLSAYAITILR